MLFSLISIRYNELEPINYVVVRALHCLFFPVGRAPHIEQVIAMISYRNHCRSVLRTKKTIIFKEMLFPFYIAICNNRYEVS